MLSYRHAFHAGNYADVLKHFIVCRILDYLTQKPGAIHYIDTHAGAGCYELHRQTAQYLGEYKQGIGLLMNLDRKALPDSVVQYLQVVNQFNQSSVLKKYPGSPGFAATLLRPQDRLSFCELQSAEFSFLLRQFSRHKNLRCYGEDGFAKARALLPPKTESRALVLIDPSYEVKDDYKKVPALVKELHRKFAVGIYAIWYPVVNQFASFMIRDLKKSGIKNIQRFEITRNANTVASGMNTTGMIIINPPWKLKQEVDELFSVFAPLLGEHAQTLNEVLVEE